MIQKIERILDLIREDLQEVTNSKEALEKTDTDFEIWKILNNGYIVMVFHLEKLLDNEKKRMKGLR